MIREATRADIPSMVRMARDFHAASPMSRYSFSPMRAAAASMAAIDNPGTLALVLDQEGLHGALLGSVRAYPLGDTLCAYEDVFWVDPSHRGKWALAMVRRFEAWAAGMDAEVVGLSCPINSAESLYARLGFTQAETTFAKGL